MPRPRLHDTTPLLDAAATLVARGGPAALTMSALAAATGAPSGSLYHRFGSRDALAAALWARTLAAFQAGYVAALDDADPHAACLAAARHVVRWCRAHPDEATVLLHGAEALGAAADAPEGRPAAERAIAATARRLGGRGARERVVFATVDIPYALVRRHLRAGARVPAGAEAMVARAAAAALAEG